MKAAVDEKEVKQCVRKVLLHSHVNRHATKIQHARSAVQVSAKMTNIVVVKDEF